MSTDLEVTNALMRAIGFMATLREQIIGLKALAQQSQLAITEEFDDVIEALEKECQALETVLRKIHGSGRFGE